MGPTDDRTDVNERLSARERARRTPARRRPGAIKDDKIADHRDGLPAPAAP